MNATLEHPGETGKRDTRTLAAILAVLTAWRIATGATVGLGDAEAYDWVWSKFPAMSYYDHPPGIAWLIHLTTSVIGDTPLGVRIGPILLFVATVTLLFRLGCELFGSRASLYGCIALIATPAFHIGGVSASPDTPLAFFWALSLLALWRIAVTGRPGWWYTLGAAMGLAFLCKYFAVLLAPMAALFLGRGELRTRLRGGAPWGAVAIALVACLPVIDWNWQHAFASIRFHLVDRHQAAGLSWQNTGRLVFGQVGYITPLLLAGYLWTMAVAMRRSSERTWAFVAATSVPVVAFFSAATLWTPEAEPHWPVLGYLPACLGLGQLVAERIALGGEIARRATRLFIGSIALPASLLLLLYVHLLTPIFVQVLPTRWYQPRFDLANELRGWPEAGLAIDRELAGMPPGTVVLAYHYTMCSQAAFAIHDPRRMRCLNTRTDALDFLGLGQIASGANAVYVRDDRYNKPPNQVYRFEREEEGPTVTITRGNRIVRTFTLTRLYGIVAFADGVNGL